MEKISHPYRKIGRLNWTVSKKAHVKAADIYISENQIIHIQNTHRKELEDLGIDATTFVSMVCRNFNQIRKGSGDSILLVIYNTRLSYVIAISLNYSIEKEFWEIKTAEPRRRRTVDKSALIWTAAKHTVSGNGDRPN